MYLASEKITDFVASDFWIALSSEVNGLREALEDENSEDEVNSHDIEFMDEPAANTCSEKQYYFLGHQRVTSVPTMVPYCISGESCSISTVLE